jgi:hypothetical protein
MAGDRLCGAHGASLETGWLMQFSTYIIEGNPDKTVVTVSNIAAGLALGALLTCMIGLYQIGTILFVIAVIAGVLLAFIKKGNIQSYVLSKNKLIITTSCIEIAGVVYEMEKIRDLHISVHSYAGLDYMSDGLKTSDGMNNYVSFVFDGKKVECRYYLDGATHTLSLCQVLQEFYYKKIPFIEVDRYGGQTYLLKRLNENELATFKNKYGY